jgi:inosose dehydratase
MSIQIASAPVSWGIYEFAGIEPRFAYATVLDQIVEAGYVGIELGPYGYLPTDAAILRDELESRKLRLLSAFVPVRLVDPDAHEQGLREALKVGRLLAELDAVCIVLADDNGKVSDLVAQAGRRSGSWLTEAQWDTFASGVNYIARRLHSETGLSVVFHHHCAGYVETPDETRALFQRVDDAVGLCLDTGHWHFAGGDALACIAEYGERVRYLHLKDCQPDIAQACREAGKNYFESVEAGVFCPLGEGMVDFTGVMQSLIDRGYSGWAVVEQDILTEDDSIPLRYACANRDYLRRLGF